MLKGFAHNFRPMKRGLGRALGDLEKDIMNILWARGGVTGKEALAEISRSKKAAITTVLTVLDRLVKKGIVKKVKGESVYIYTPALTKDEFTDIVSHEVMRGVLDISASSAVASFVDVLAEADPKELDRLSRLIEKKKKELRKGT
ncbi:MAG: BlaI/MecI/CopY family transcriptional regulator [Deltaproteobacteria bacterium]|nr:BlaI/MecI/CopY family transcriptional regulator [Deltaproteobacteria bacterium]